MFSLGVVATVISIIGGIPYIYDTYKKKTKPHRFAWFIFLVLSILAWATQYSLGARESLVFYTWFVVNNIILLGLSLRKNGGYGDLTKVNVICLLLALAAIVLWRLTDSALLALVCVLIADGIGALLILVKSYKHPHTETLSMWLAGCVATFLNILAANTLEPAICLLSVQIFILNVGIVVAIMVGRSQKKNSKSPNFVH